MTGLAALARDDGARCARSGWRGVTRGDGGVFRPVVPSGSLAAAPSNAILQSAHFIMMTRFRRNLPVHAAIALSSVAAGNVEVQHVAEQLAMILRPSTAFASPITQSDAAAPAGAIVFRLGGPAS